MALLYPDILEHSNTDLPLVDSTSIKGGTVTVASRGALTSLKASKLTRYVTRVNVVGDSTPAYDGWYTFTGASNSSLSDWTKDTSTYTLPTATDSQLGGIKIGAGLTITDGVVSTDLTFDGTTNAIPKFDGSTIIDSSITDGSTTVAINVDKVVITKSNGDIVTQGSITAVGGGFDSDIRLKTILNKSPYPVDIDEIKAKRYIKDGVEHTGYIAQDVEEHLPSAVIYKEDGYLAVQYHEVLVAKVQYLEDMVDKLFLLLNK